MTAETEAAAALLSTSGRINGWLMQEATRSEVSLEKLHLALTLEIAVTLLCQLGDDRPLGMRATAILADKKEQLLADAVKRVRNSQTIL